MKFYIGINMLKDLKIGSGILELKIHQLPRSEEHTSELQSPCNLVCRLLLEKKKNEFTRSTHSHAKPTAPSRALRCILDALVYNYITVLLTHYFSRSTALAHFTSCLDSMWRV